MVADLIDSGFTFAPAFQVIATRPITAPFSTIRFSESLGTFQLANAKGHEIITPETTVEQALQKLTIVEHNTPLKKRQNLFNRPFNTIFMPAEYASINCCFSCSLANCGPGALGGDGDTSGCCPPCDPPSPGGTPPGITLTQGPPTINVSSGDTTDATAKSVSVTVSPSGASDTVVFTTAFRSNPNSSSQVQVAIQGSGTSATGTASFRIVPTTPTGASSPSGIFQTVACGSVGECASQATVITIPPQILMQLLYGEAHGQTTAGDTMSEPAVGSTIKNRFGRSEFPGGSASTYQAVIVSSQFAGIATSITTGAQPELDNATALFNGTTGDVVGGAPCFFSPTANGYAALQAALASKTTTVPSVSFDPLCYGGATPGRQIVIKTSIPNNINGSGAPAFVFERQKASDTDPAVIQIN